MPSGCGRPCSRSTGCTRAVNRLAAFAEPPTEGIRKLYDARCEDRPGFGREDLPFMEPAAAHAAGIPSQTLLEPLSDARRQRKRIPDYST